MKPSPSSGSRNPVTVLDYLSFGVGAVGGAFVTHLYHYSDLGHSIPAGGFAAMGLTRAVLASSDRWWTIRRLKKRSAAIALRLDHTSTMNVDDLQAHLGLSRLNWGEGQGDFFTDEQFEAALNRIVKDFNKRQHALLKSSKFIEGGTRPP